MILIHFCFKLDYKELGNLKDTGLNIEKIKQCIFISEDITAIEAKNKTISILGFKKTIESDILKILPVIVEYRFIKR